MENKKDLAKIALAALILASTTPVNGQAEIVETQGIFLASGCAAHGCPAVNNDFREASSYNREFNTAIQGQGRQAAATASNASVTLTETQLLNMLNDQGRAIYFSLDSEGKALAIQLASQDSYRDKNLAVKEAQRRINERHDRLNR